MKRLISYLDLTAPKFNLFINGKSSYRTFWGGVFHLISMIIFVIIFIFTLKQYDKHEPSQIVINTSEYPLNEINRSQIFDNQTISINVNPNITEFHQFYYSGYIYSNKTNASQNKMDSYYNENSETVNFNFNLSNIDFNHSDFFIISFPRCNNKTYICNTNKTEKDYNEFINDETKNIFYFNLKLPTLSININTKKDESKFINKTEDNIIYVNKKRGIYYLVYLNLIVVEEYKGIIYTTSDKKYGFTVDRVEPVTVDDYSWNELSYSVFFKLQKTKTIVYKFTYDTIFSAFSFIGGLNNFISLFYTIKNILSLHFADIFMLNYHFLNTFHRNKDESNSDFSISQSIKDINMSANTNQKSFKELGEINKRDFNDSKGEQFLKNFNIDIDDLDIQKGKKKEKNNYQLNFAYDESHNFLGYCGFLKYKIFKCCLKNDKSKYLYLNYKWILDINYLLRMYLQIKMLKGVLLTPNQKKLLENLSLIEKIDVFARLNMDNFYLKKPIKNEEHRQRLINKEINSFIRKMEPYEKEDNYDKDEDAKFIQKLIYQD